MASKMVRQMSGDDLYWRWREHIAIIADDVLGLLNSRARFVALLRVIPKDAAHRKESADAVRWVLSLWGTEALIAIRRELDDQAGVINIRHLLYEIEQRPEVLTRSRFMEGACPLACWCHHPKEKEVATRRFESFDLIRFTGVDGDADRDYIDHVSVQHDLAMLENESSNVLKYAQLRVANRTPKRDVDVTFSEIDEAINCIEHCVRKYYRLLTSAELTPKKVRPPKGWRDRFGKTWTSKSAA
jgi:hypothetical protein